MSKTSYVVSARKHRPISFDEVVGQSHITVTLKNEIAKNRLAQAFLFCGPRGVGKTSTARILAKEVNSEAIDLPKNYDFSYNIFELDAASNNGVDDIRELVDQVRIPPQIGKYKVYIIDEVHMLTTAAFNAFLKTLEEPPSYAIFILATTEKHKVLPTILSRCQVFNFKKLSVLQLTNHLKNICDKEGIEAEDSALQLIAIKSDGAARDALSIFDQMVSFSSEENKLNYAEVIENLNVLDYDCFIKFTEYFLVEDIEGVLTSYHDLIELGFNPGLILEGLVNHFRTLLVVDFKNAEKLLEIPDLYLSKYQKQKAKISKGWVVNALNIANESSLSFSNSLDQRFHVEMALIKISYLKSQIDLLSELKKKENKLV